MAHAVKQSLPASLDASLTPMEPLAIVSVMSLFQKMALSLTQQLEIYCLTTSYRVSEVL